MGRRASRELAMKLLYQLEIQKDDKEEQVMTALSDDALTEKDKQYITEVVDGVAQNVEKIDKIIESYSKGWKINRIPKVDLSILRLAIFEITFRSDIPLNVSINEAVELAKKYSTEDAGGFINGILGKVPEAKNAAVEGSQG